MEEQRFDQLTKELSAPVTRRGALKALVAAAVGGVLTQLNGGIALADDCKALGDRCEKDSQCCSAICVGDSAKNSVCRCPPRTVPCRGRCVPQCCAPLVLNPDTCGCMCPKGTQPCPNRLTGQITCCPPGKICSPTDAGCVCPPQQCPAGQVQDPDTCACVCPPGATACVDATGALTCCSAPFVCAPNGGCVCGNTCPPGTTLDPATCACNPSPCPNGTPPCVNPATGASVCCDTNQTCVNGTCTSTCPPGQTHCPGSGPGVCTNLNTDVNNCGQCGNVCPQVPNATVGCNAGQCHIAMCAPGYADCDNNFANGCEINITTSNQNCGGCGIQCSASQTCFQGVCVG